MRPPVLFTQVCLAQNYILEAKGLHLPMSHKVHTQNMMWHSWCCSTNSSCPGGKPGRSKRQEGPCSVGCPAQISCSLGDTDREGGGGRSRGSTCFMKKLEHGKNSAQWPSKGIWVTIYRFIPKCLNCNNPSLLLPFTRTIASKEVLPNMIFGSNAFLKGR